MIALHDRFPPRGRTANYHPRTSPKLNPSNVRGAVAHEVDGYYLGEKAVSAVNSERIEEDMQQVR
eukprot:7268642-Heterocapsa_arctica.AAC.1